uniref:Uncharacterized protein n=1 Tax=Globisporangium ultimum (strain ATCC 200006 / CBS 805.95 / DAOM BR144) TaxID=431595 RepID=K3WGA3_GLOUD
MMLTTHSMKECEALCSRAGIVVGGRLRCFDSIPHLKTRFGEGFLRECKLDAPDVDTIVSFLANIRAEQEVDLTFSCSQLPGICAALGKLDREKWTHFGVDCTALLERQADFCRFKLTKRAASTEDLVYAAELVGSSEAASLSLSRVFQLAESAKSSLHLKEYSVSETSLEQIFNAFAGQQEEETRVAKGIWSSAPAT